MHVRQLGLSPKLLAPVITALSAVVTSAIVTGRLDRTQLAVLATSLIGAAAAWLAPTGEVTVPDLEELPFDVDDALTGQ